MDPRGRYGEGKRKKVLQPVTPIPHSRPWIDGSDVATVESVMRSGLIADGQRVAQFERCLARRLGLRTVQVTGSGTHALVLALTALSMAPGDEVILPTYVCRSVEEAIRLAGARPVFADSGPNWTVSISDVQAKQTPRTRAVVAVHTFGFAADVTALNDLGVPVVEDACQSFGLQILGQQAGTLGALGVFSMHATKCFTAGVGGAVVSRDDEIVHRIRKLVGSTSGSLPISDIDAALGLSQLERYGSMLARRSSIAARYLAEFADLPIELPDSTDTIFFRFPIRLRESFVEQKIQAFAAQGIAVRRGVDTLVHRRTEHSDLRFPRAARDYDTTLSLPIYPSLLESEQERIIEVALRVLA